MHAALQVLSKAALLSLSLQFAQNDALGVFTAVQGKARMGNKVSAGIARRQHQSRCGGAAVLRSLQIGRLQLRCNLPYLSSPQLVAKQ